MAAIPKEGYLLIHTSTGEQVDVRITPDLCATCRDAFDEKCHSYNFRYPSTVVCTYHNLRDLPVWAEDGCDLCVFLYKELFTLYPGKFGAYAVLHKDERAIKLDLSITDDRGRVFRMLLSGIGRLTITSGALPHDQNPGRLRLQHCLDHHPQCSAAYNSGRILPTRLLDVGELALDDPSVPTVQLKLTHAIVPGPRLQYVCLSYRWPAEGMLCLTESSLAQFQDCIPIQDALSTIQDAVMITRLLGFRYLWVDSLCIIQDSPTDWEHESAMMGEIYQGGICTLAALYATRPSYVLPLQWIPYWFGPWVADEEPLEIGRTYLAEPDLRQEELLTRGWVVQEHLLSPRTIYFNNRELLWECVTYAATKRSIHAIRRGDVGFNDSEGSLKHALSTFHPQLGSRPSPADLLRCQIAWSQILFRYTSCQLTRSSDRLVAVNGIIQNIKNQCGFKFAAGLCKEFLLADLLWHKVSDSYAILSTTESMGTYRAPTWSWAMRDGPITNTYPVLVRGYELDLQWHASVEKIEVSGLPNGTVHSAQMVLKAPHIADKRSVLARFWGSFETWKASKWNAQMAFARSARVVHEDNITKMGDHDCEWVAILIGRGQGSQLTLRGQNKDSMECNCCDVGLLLKNVEGKENVWERVGLFEEHYWEKETWPLFCGRDLSDRQTFTIV